MTRVLICPLNWGRGHATRMIPIIRYLNMHADVTIGGNGASKELLQSVFPKLKCVDIPGITVRLSNHKWRNYLHYVFLVFQILRANKQEKRWLKNNSANFDVVLSDNRYGLFHSQVKSILITHQTAVPVPLLKRVTNVILRNWISHFNEVWIPDDPEMKLSEAFWQKEIKAKQIGWLSSWEINEVASENYWLLIASGPEPAKRNFIALVKSKFVGNLKIADGIYGEDLNLLVERAEGIISKAGYSTIMDLCMAGKKGILVPTPGQREQEILAANPWVQKRFYCLSMSELKQNKHVDIDMAPNVEAIKTKTNWKKELKRILDEDYNKTKR